MSRLTRRLSSSYSFTLRTLRLCGRTLFASPRVHRNRPLNGPPAHGAEGFMPREHDAVDFGTVIPLRLVVRTLEGSDFPCVFLRPQHGIFFFALCAEELIHLFFGFPRRAQLFALLLDLALETVELIFVPGRGQR